MQEQQKDTGIKKIKNILQTFVDEFGFSIGDVQFDYTSIHDNGITFFIGSKLKEILEKRGVTTESFEELSFDQVTTWSVSFDDPYQLRDILEAEKDIQSGKKKARITQGKRAVSVALQDLLRNADFEGLKKLATSVYYNEGLFVAKVKFNGKNGVVKEYQESDPDALIEILYSRFLPEIPSLIRRAVAIVRIRRKTLIEHRKRKRNIA